MDDVQLWEDENGNLAWKEEFETSLHPTSQDEWETRKKKHSDEIKPQYTVKCFPFIIFIFFELKVLLYRFILCDIVTMLQKIFDYAIALGKENVFTINQYILLQNYRFMI